MRATIKRSDEGLVLALERPLVEELGLTEGTEVELSSNGESFVVTPVRDVERERLFRASAEKVLERHAGLFERLSK